MLKCRNERKNCAWINLGYLKLFSVFCKIVHQKIQILKKIIINNCATLYFWKCLHFIIEVQFPITSSFYLSFLKCLFCAELRQINEMYIHFWKSNEAMTIFLSWCVAFFCWFTKSRECKKEKKSSSTTSNV